MFVVGLIVNTALLSIPIGATLGTLFGIRPFRGDRAPEPPKNITALVTETFCDEFHLFAQNKIGTNYTLNSNEILPEAESTLCMTSTTYQNSTYPTNSTAPVFSFTWSYPFTLAPSNLPKNFTQHAHPLIHAFPQATISTLDPITLEDIGELNLDFAWSMGTGNDIAPATSSIRLSANQVNATVALDMYLDADGTTAANSSAAAFEMIIFFAKYGLEDPVGFGNGSIVTTGTLNGVVFNLFAGQNSNGQSVFSWVATEPVTNFKGNIAPLFLDVINLPNAKALNVTLPTFTTSLGYMGFGTQAYNAVGNVTFAVPTLSMDIRPFAS